MVLLSASICTKSGKVLIARQFMDMSRSRVEGLLAAFPKLINSGEQHTFVETDNVRYVYQPMDSLFMVLITTKNSNILEDLETLRLFARVIPEYCREMTELEVQDCAFELIFAFDEIVALGYREQVNLNQIKTFTEMDSHEENVAKMVAKSKAAEQREISKRREKEIALQKRLKGMGGAPFGGSGGMGSGSMGMNSGMGGNSGSDISIPARTLPPPASKSSSSKKKSGGLKLGKNKAKKEDDFEAKLMSEGQTIAPVTGSSGGDLKSAPSSRKSTEAPEIDREAVHIKVEEKITLEANHDGGLENLEVKGIILTSVSDPAYSRIKIKTALSKKDKKIPFQTHPNVDKKQFNNESIITLKSNKPFPNGSEVGVVKWRIQSADEDDIPLTINCWPTDNSDGTADVNVEYELVDKSLVLENVIVTIPVPGQPSVGSVDGEYNYERRDGVLEWIIPQISEDNAEGSLEFNCSSVSGTEDFFPCSVNFNSSTTLAGITITGVEQADGGDEVPYSTEVSLQVDNYEYA